MLGAHYFILIWLVCFARFRQYPMILMQVIRGLCCLLKCMNLDMLLHVQHWKKHTTRFWKILIRLFLCWQKKQTTGISTIGLRWLFVLVQIFIMETTKRHWKMQTMLSLVKNTLFIQLIIIWNHGDWLTLPNHCLKWLSLPTIMHSVMLLVIIVLLMVMENVLLKNPAICINIWLLIPKIFVLVWSIIKKRVQTLEYIQPNIRDVTIIFM